jgi:hypothetical protein
MHVGRASAIEKRCATLPASFCFELFIRSRKKSRMRALTHSAMQCHHALHNLSLLLLRLGHNAV